MGNKEQYKLIASDEKYSSNIPIFSMPFWLDVVAESWDACIVEDKGKVVAALPFCIKGKLLTKRIYLPDLSFYQSPVFFQNADKSTQLRITKELLQQLPATIKSYFKFLPQYSAIDLTQYGYEKEKYSTHIIRNENDVKLSSNHSRNVSKGQKMNYAARESKNLSASYSILVSTFKRQGVKPKISEAEFIKIAKLTKKHNSGKVLDCFDQENNLLASAFVVYDAASFYYLLGGYNTAYKNSGGMTYLLHSCIQQALQNQKEFNFCGSSKKSIAEYFKGFGAREVPIVIWKKGWL
jgi:hypothetical protein